MGFGLCWVTICRPLWGFGASGFPSIPSGFYGASRGFCGVSLGACLLGLGAWEGWKEIDPNLLSVLASGVYPWFNSSVSGKPFLFTV
jgi:hypothetical protein